jgi:hypothetical protein
MLNKVVVSGSRGNKMSSKVGKALIPLFGVLVIILQNQYSALAIDPTFYNKLARSRDALLAQKDSLQRSYDDASRRIDELNKKLDMLRSYMRETDSALADVDRAMRQ